MATDINASEEAGASVPIPRTKDDEYRADYGSDMELRADSAEGRTLTGHFNKFNEWTEIRSAREGNFFERVAPGAFTKTIKENLSRMRVLFNHGHDVLGEQILGPIRSLEEDDIGARYEVELFDSVPKLIVDGLRAKLYGASFRFRVMREDFDDNPKRSDQNPQGIPERTLREVQVQEFGPVTFGAYPGATAGVRSLTDIFVLRPYVSQPELFRSALEDWQHFLKDLPAVAPEEDGEAKPGNAPTEDRAEQDAHPVDVRRESEPLFWFTNHPLRSK